MAFSELKLVMHLKTNAFTDYLEGNYGSLELNYEDIENTNLD